MGDARPGPTVRVFINYRRGDTQAEAGRLYDWLKLREHDVFKDIDTIRGGRDFRKEIDRALDHADVVLALIGKSWAKARDSKRRLRLEDPADFVRLELQRALQRDDVFVIPVLVEGATMPRLDDLPEPLQDLAYRQALMLTDARWSTDVAKLIESIEEAATEIAESHAVRDADAQRESEEQARREAEEQGRRESEALRESEEQARREAEARARREAEALREAEVRTQRESEERTQRDAEERARLEAQGQARRDAKERARREAMARAEAEAVARATTPKPPVTVDEARGGAETTAPGPRRRVSAKAWVAGGILLVAIAIAVPVFLLRDSGGSGGSGFTFSPGPESSAPESSPSPTEASLGIPLVTQDFEQPASEWAPYENENCRATLDGGAFHLVLKASVGCNVHDTNDDSLTDVRVVTHAGIVTGTPDAAGYGVICRSVSGSRYRAYVRHDGAYAIDRIRNDKLKELTDGEAGSVIVEDAADGTSEIRLDCIGPASNVELTFYVNGIEVGRVVDSHGLDSGEVGLTLVAYRGKDFNGFDVRYEDVAAYQP